jgi:hypothetical protein
MKKLICLLGHNKKLMKTSDCKTEKFENDSRKIVVHKCKYCDADVSVQEMCLKGYS